MRTTTTVPIVMKIETTTTIPIAINSKQQQQSQIHIHAYACTGVCYKRAEEWVFSPVFFDLASHSPWERNHKDTFPRCLLCFRCGYSFAGLIRPALPPTSSNAYHHLSP